MKPVCCFLALTLLAGCTTGPSSYTASVPELPPSRSARSAENPWQSPRETALSTFSIDVDTGSYSLVRQHLSNDMLPPAELVRVEEMVNYFPYDYAPPARGQTFAVHEELSDCPWERQSRLLKIGIQAEQLPSDQLPPRNLVFLIDVSGSMNGPERLGLVVHGLSRLVTTLSPRDHVAIVTYAGASGTALEPTAGDQQKTILAALARLETNGSTHGESGIRHAYALARQHFDKSAINRVLLATDGDFNVGMSSREQLVKLIEEERKSGAFLTTLGVGQDGAKDENLEQLADKGNGNYAHLDDLAEAEKVLVRESSSTLVPVAKDVKIQVEFNPHTVDSYRLLGYENRALEAQDFNDDSKDAGEVGAGHRVTAFYQIRTRQPGNRPTVDPSRYQSAGANNQEYAQVKVRYQPPAGGASKLITQVVTTDQYVPLIKAGDDFRFAAAVAQFGLLLRGSEGSGNYRQVEHLAQKSRGQDTLEYRAQFLKLVANARRLKEAQANR